MRASDGETVRGTRRNALISVAGVLSAGFAGCLDAAATEGSDRRSPVETAGTAPASEPATRAGTEPGTETTPEQPIAVAVSEPVPTVSVRIVAGDGDADGPRFDPQLAWIAVGGTVGWRNEDSDRVHDTAAYPRRVPDEDDVWASPGLDAGETYARSFDRPGIYDYVSTASGSGTVGRIVVGEPDPATAPALADDRTRLAPEARAVFAALDGKTENLLTNADCGCPE